MELNINGALDTAYVYGAVLMSAGSKNFVDDARRAVEEAGKKNNNAEYKKPKSGSGKEKATEVPSWAKGNKLYIDENGKDFAKRLMDKQYGTGSWENNNARMKEYQKIKKWGNRGFE